MYSEAFTSDVFLQMEAEVESNRSPDDPMPHLIYLFMGFTDGTHLASFGTASLEATYFWPGNLSQMIRE